VHAELSEFAISLSATEVSSAGTLMIHNNGTMPHDSPYAADTILVAPGERYTVLIHAETAGTWVWHCHILNHVESADGMFGMVTALVVE
jgi:FtsP/CotA-like multicopper oxidase with cupredoxin domain